MWVRGFIIGVIITCILHRTSSKPYLHHALINLATSASASASSGSTSSLSSARLTNIVDYSRKQEKAKELQMEKQLVEDDDINEDPFEKDNNEASPSLIQKKINKILSKIQLFFSTTTEKYNSTESTTEGLKREIKMEIEEVTRKKTDQNFIVPNKNYGIPLKINLEINSNENSTEIEENVEGDGNNQYLNRIGQIGVFFIELFGSLVGLAYGAVAHINNAVQGTPETAV